MLKTSIIHRRDLEPLRAKASEVVYHYEQASDCRAAIIGADRVSVEFPKNPKALLFCKLCKRYCQCGWKFGPDEVPCLDMHLQAVQEACKRGGSHVYTCKIGFFFWTSPFFSGERFAGALTSGGPLSVDKELLLDRIYQLCKGEVSRAQIIQYIEGLPEKNREEVNALAQMMMLCAEQISCRDSNLDDLPGHEIVQSSPDFHSVFLEQERSLIASLRRGDNNEAGNIMRTMLNDLNTAVNGNLDSFKLKIMELVVMLSRTGANSESNQELVESSNRFLKRIENSKTVEEVSANIRSIVEQMAGKIFSFQGIRHASALRKAERFIWENYSRKISLKEIADISGLSAPYFSTIFKDEMGENLSNYLNRLRVEKASSMLRETDSPISGISVACGFEDQSWFSKVFKCYTGYSPSKYREHGG
jgi:AraC-like DNA-binding protein/ligand-binding sensor protein